MGPEVSVIISTYNRAHYVPHAIQSVLDQTFEDFEIIVVDDASTDNTKEVIEKFEDERICYIRHKKNKGGSATRNTGIKHSRGRFIAFLDDDDLWMPTKLEKQLDLIKNNPRIGVVYTGALEINNSGKVRGFHIPSRRGNIFPDILRKNYVGSCSRVLVRKECLDKSGFFDENLPAIQDFDLWVRLAKRYEFDYVEEPLVLYRVHEKRISTNPYIKMQAIKLIKKKLSKELDMVNNRKILGSWHYAFGRVYCRCGDMGAGKREFVNAIRKDPFSILYYTRLFASFFGLTIYNALFRLLDSALPTSFKDSIIWIS